MLLINVADIWHYQIIKIMLQNQGGGGELIIKGLDSKIRSKDTIAPGNDPFLPRDTEN